MLLLLVVMTPTLGLLWFVSLAMRNEQLAHRQRLTDAYRGHLLNVQQHIDEHWQQIVRDVGDDVKGATSSENAQQRFADAITNGQCDSVICFNTAGDITYPQTQPATAGAVLGSVWDEANRVEFERQNPSAAADIYEGIAASATSPYTRAVAIRAQVRCLFKNRQQADALQLVNATSKGELALVRDAQRRVIVAGIELMAVELVKDRTLTLSILQRLQRRLQQHDEQRLPATQRLFIMKRLHQMDASWVDERTLHAEDLAARFVAAHPSPARKPALRQSQLADVWQIDSGGDMLLLYSTDTATRLCETAAARASLPKDIDVAVLSPGDQPAKSEILSIAAGPRLPGWRLSLAAPAELDNTTSQQQAIYIWAGLLVAGFTSILAMVIAAAFHQKIRVANLKNDLVGTVSHELKTPLSSMRLLVDTLLDSPELDPQRTREYLQLIARENARLSRMIENFLTFSRLERSSQALELHAVDVNEIVTRAVEAAGERFHGDDCNLSLQLDQDIPSARADADALLIVLLNLLDNAYKYSSPPREIEIRTFKQAQRIHISVTDNGRGLTSMQRRQVFQKFYQVDQSLNRKDGGCGLGLAIVSSIVRASGGEVQVKSRPEMGSTFTVTLDAARVEKTEV